MDTQWIIAAALFLIAGVIYFTKKDEAKSRSGVPNHSSGWWINYSTGYPERPTTQGSGFTFDFVVGPQAHIHYVQNYNPPRLRLDDDLVIDFTIEGDGFVPVEYPEKPALVTVMIQRRGDNMGAQGEYASYRWFSNATIRMEPGRWKIAVPLDVSQWGDVFGGKDARLFKEALNDVSSVGILFGSAGGRGHGIYAKNTARFTLHGLSLV